MIHLPEYICENNPSLDNICEEINKVGSGFFPVGKDGFWHGGVHLPLINNASVYPLIPGQLLAYRISTEYKKIKFSSVISSDEYAKIKDGSKWYGDKEILNNASIHKLREECKDIADWLHSDGFILLKHTIFVPENKKGTLKQIDFFSLYSKLAIDSELQITKQCSNDFVELPMIRENTEKPLEKTPFYRTWIHKINPAYAKELVYYKVDDKTTTVYPYSHFRIKIEVKDIPLYKEYETWKKVCFVNTGGTEYELKSAHGILHNVPIQLKTKTNTTSIYRIQTLDKASIEKNKVGAIATGTPCFFHSIPEKASAWAKKSDEYLTVEILDGEFSVGSIAKGWMEDRNQIPSNGDYVSYLNLQANFYKFTEITDTSFFCYLGDAWYVNESNTTFPLFSSQNECMLICDNGNIVYPTPLNDKEFKIKKNKAESKKSQTMKKPQVFRCTLLFQKTIEEQFKTVPDDSGVKGLPKRFVYCEYVFPSKNKTTDTHSVMIKKDDLDMVTYPWGSLKNEDYLKSKCPEKIGKTGKKGFMLYNSPRGLWDNMEFKASLPAPANPVECLDTETEFSIRNFRRIIDDRETGVYEIVIANKENPVWMPIHNERMLLSKSCVAKGYIIDGATHKIETPIKSLSETNAITSGSRLTSKDDQYCDVSMFFTNDDITKVKLFHYEVNETTKLYSAEDKTKSFMVTLPIKSQYTIVNAPECSSYEEAVMLETKRINLCFPKDVFASDDLKKGVYKIERMPEKIWMNRITFTIQYKKNAEGQQIEKIACTSSINVDANADRMADSLKNCLPNFIGKSFNFIEESGGDYYIAIDCASVGLKHQFWFFKDLLPEGVNIENNVISFPSQFAGSNNPIQNFEAYESDPNIRDFKIVDYPVKEKTPIRFNTVCIRRDSAGVEFFGFEYSSNEYTSDIYTGELYYVKSSDVTRVEPVFSPDLFTKADLNTDGNIVCDLKEEFLKPIEECNRKNYDIENLESAKEYLKKEQDGGIAYTTDKLMNIFSENEDSIPVRKEIRRMICMHPLENNKTLYANIDGELKEKASNIQTKDTKKELDDNADVVDIWKEIESVKVDGKTLFTNLKNKNLYFVHPIYFLQTMDEYGILPSNPYAQAKTITSDSRKYDIRNLNYGNLTHKVIDNPGFAPEYRKHWNKASPCALNGRQQKYPLAVINGLYNEDYGYVDTYFRQYQTFFHEGVDFRGVCEPKRPPTPIYSCIHGVVILNGIMSGYGRSLLIKDSNKDVLYLLGHLRDDSKITDGLPKGVKKGDKVAPGMIVGYVGKSGYSDRFSETMYPQHLHLGVLECSTFKQDKIIIKNNSIYEWIGDMIFADGRIKYVNPFNHAEYGCVRIKL